jgi:hypothetical protein
MDMQQVTEITRQLRDATAAVTRAQGDVPTQAIEQLDAATRETLEALYRTRQALNLPDVGRVPELVTDDTPSHSRSASRVGAAKRAKSDRIAKNNAAFFQQMNLTPEDEQPDWQRDESAASR